MKIFESVEERLHADGEVRRSMIFQTLRSSAVLVRVPPNHSFPLHIHPSSEDCFFLLSGSGELVGEERTLSISEFTVVWVPVGVPHGVVAGPSGMFEIGFQSPPDSTAIQAEAGVDGAFPRGMLAETLSIHPQSTGSGVGWVPVFQGLRSRYLEPHYCVLNSSQRLRAAADGYELIVIVARGAMELPEVSKPVSAFAAVHVSPGETLDLCAVESPTLLLGVSARLTD